MGSGAAESRIPRRDLRSAGDWGAGGPSGRRGRALDHNSAEWSLWIGRPLLGQWVHDVRQLVRAMESVEPGLVRSVSVVGVGPAGIVAISSATGILRLRRWPPAA